MHPLTQFKYCPECGSAGFTVNNEKSKKCLNCGFIYYFNPSAATAAFILNDKKELLVCRRAKAPARGTLDMPGGFLDMNETAEEGITREIFEETGLKATVRKYLFSLPNIYKYSGFMVHTLDMFFLCDVAHIHRHEAADDVSEIMFIPLDRINPEDFGLPSVKKAVRRFVENIDKILND